MAKEYEGIKLPALRKIAEDKGLEGYEDLEREELLKLLEGSDSEGKEEDEEEKEDEEKEEEVPGPKKEVGIIEGKTPVGSKAEIMKARLALQEKVTIMIPLEPKEKKGSTFPVTLNGYRLNIQKGTYVSVPKQVAEIVMDSQDQTVAAADELKRVDGSPMKIDGDTPSALN